MLLEIMKRAEVFLSLRILVLESYRTSGQPKRGTSVNRFFQDIAFWFLATGDRNGDSRSVKQVFWYCGSLRKCHKVKAISFQ